MVSDQEIGVSADEIDPVGRRMLDVLLTIEEACIPYQEEMMAQGLDRLGERIFLPRTNDRGDWRKAGDSLFDADIHRQDIKELLTRYDDTPLMNSSKNRYMRQINACIIRIVYFGGLRQTEIVRLLKKSGIDINKQRVGQRIASTIIELWKNARYKYQDLELTMS